MDEFLPEFKSESLELVQQMLNLLEGIEGDFQGRAFLEQYGQIVDRIMGGAKNMALGLPSNQQIKSIAAYAEICKVIGYRGSQIEKNEGFYSIVVAFLLDATEMLREMIDSLGTPNEQAIGETLKGQLLDRLHWIAGQFDENLRASVAIDKSANNNTAQKEIQDLLKGLGLSR